MIIVEISPSVDSLKKDLKYDYDTFTNDPRFDLDDDYIMFPLWLIHVFVVGDDGYMRALTNKVFKTNDEIEEYTQAVKNAVEDRLTEEGALFNILIEYIPGARTTNKLRYKLDYSVYTGTEDTELLNI